MFVAVVTCEVMIYESSSLKEKRMVVRKLKDKFFSKYKVLLSILLKTRNPSRTH